jgi:hypothetical protein
VTLAIVRPQTLALFLAAGVPFVAYVVTLSGYAYWLDSGEFVAAAVQLDIAHPPGHPLSALFGSAMALLPLGSLAFRVALGQALASSIASALHCRGTAAAISSMRLPERVRWSLALFGAWLSAFSYGLWFQAIRPEVYALQTLCSALVFERLMRFACDPAANARALVGAAFGLGIALTNHHLIGFLLAPAFLPALVWIARSARWRSLACAFGLGALALSTYAYLPLRAAAKPPANLGDPSSVARFLWVVSARVYARDLGSEAVQSLRERFVDVLALWVESFSFWPIALALVGLYALVRHPATRRAGIVSASVLVTDVVARAWLGPVRANPDILGYLAPGLLMTGTFAAAGLAAGVSIVRERQPMAAGPVERAAPLVPLLACLLLPPSAAASSLAHFAATDAFDELRIRRLPTRALVLASTPQTVFRAWELNATEALRPDVTTLALPFLGYPGAREAVLREHPELTALVDAYSAARDRLPSAELSQLAQTRPLFVELDTRLSPATYGLLRPRGLLVEVPARREGMSKAALERELDRDFDRLDASLGEDLHETETARQLLWVHYMNALQLGALGLRELAERELARALALHPSDRRLRALARALADPRPFRVEPFLDF